ncbi:MAG TPA: MBL fold metallo-hydrolase [Candidatus Acidoferrales bacterium]|nr:MBL fold metallo-hydrolase [Candidatus Acidoferrales bacterium]
MATVRRVLAPNPGPFTGPGTNTWLVGDGPALILIDPGPDSSEHRSAIAERLGAAALGLILVTHGHPDHLEGAERLGRDHHCRVTRYPELADSDVVRVGGLALTAIFTPGHAGDHLAFWMPDDRVLFCGDLILGQGSSVVAWPEGDMAAYLHSLQRVMELAPRILFPGHFDPVLDGPAKIAEYRAHRLQREAAVRAALDPAPRDVATITELVYASELAGHADREALMRAASASVRAHLEKLVAEGAARAVVAEGADLAWVSTSAPSDPPSGALPSGPAPAHSPSP